MSSIVNCLMGDGSGGGCKRKRVAPCDQDDFIEAQNKTPNDYDSKYLTSYTYVVMNSAQNLEVNGKLTLQLERALQNVVGYRLDSMVLPNPLYLGDTNVMYVLASNLASTSLDQGKTPTGTTLPILATVERASAAVASPFTTYKNQSDRWFRYPNPRQVDIIEIGLYDHSCVPITTAAASTWSVCLSFLFVIDQ